MRSPKNVEDWKVPILALSGGHVWQKEIQANYVPCSAYIVGPAARDCSILAVW